MTAPSVGRIVHYVVGGGNGALRACCAAVVTAQTRGSPECLSLCVMTPDGLIFAQEVDYFAGLPLKAGETRPLLCGSKDYGSKSWHWPARVD